MSSNLIPAANSGKTEHKHTNQPERLHFVASVFTNAHWDTTDGKDKNTSTEQRGEKKKGLTDSLSLYILRVRTNAVC